MPGLKLKNLLPLTDFLLVKRCGVVTEFEITRQSVSTGFDNDLNPDLIFERIEKYTFSKCESLKCIHIPNGVTSIETCAFEWCRNLENIELPDTIIYIGKNAFYNCYSIKEIKIPKGSMKKFDLLLPELINYFVES